MTKTKFLLVSFVLLMTVTLHSCLGNLNPEPSIFISSDAKVFGDSSRLATFLNGVYARLKSGQFYGGRYIVYQEVRGSDFINRTSNGVTAFQTWNFSVVSSSNEVNNLWLNAYRAINAANIGLDGLESYSKSIISSGSYNNYKGEMYFVRALSYFALLQLYARPFWDNPTSNKGLPLRLKAEKDGQMSPLKRATVQEVYTQILADLDQAESLLPPYYSNTTNSVLNVTRAHKNTAIALKTRVYLSMGNYTKVIEEAQKIVDETTFNAKSSGGVLNGLETSVSAIFTAPYTSKESIISMPFTSVDIPGTQNNLSLYFSSSAAAEYRVNTESGSTFTLYGTTDTRKNLFAVKDGLNYLNKYKQSNASDYVAIIRWAEVLLNYAESLSRVGSGVDATGLAILNKIRTRSSASTLAPTTKQALLDSIIRERKLELIGEGFTSSDIMRLGLNFLAKPGAPQISSSSQSYIWPLPDNEVLFNSAINN